MIRQNLAPGEKGAEEQCPFTVEIVTAAEEIEKARVGWEHSKRNIAWWQAFEWLISTGTMLHSSSIPARISRSAFRLRDGAATGPSGPRNRPAPAFQPRVSLWKQEPARAN